MAFIPVPDCALAVVNFTATDGETFSNTFWFAYPNFSLSDQENLAAAIDSSFAGPFKSNPLSSYISYTNTTVYDMRTSTGPIVVNVTSAGAGGQSVDVAPLNVAGVVTYYTASRGRSGRGRGYFTGMPDENWVNGYLTTAVANGLVGLLGAMQSATALQGWDWVVVSRYTNGAPRPEGVYNAITNILMRSRKAGTQRRRIDRP